MKKFLSVIGILMIGLFIITGCSANKEKEAVSQNSNEGFVLEYPSHLKEKFGESLKMEKDPEKIMVMTTTPVQSLYELGVKLDTIPENKSIEWPADLDAKKVKVEMTVLDTEMIIASKPDLLILSEFSAQQYRKTFEDNGIKCYFTSGFKNIASVKEELAIFAKAFGKEDKGNEILAKFDAVEKKISSISAGLERQKALVLSGYPLKYVQSKQGFTGQMVSLFNLDIITEDATSMVGTTEINMEEIVEKNPQIIIAVGSSEDEKEIESNYKAEFAKNKQVWDKVDAIKNNNIIYLDKSFEKSAGIKILGNLESLVEKFSKGDSK